MNADMISIYDVHKKKINK